MLLMSMNPVELTSRKPGCVLQNRSSSSRAAFCLLIGLLQQGYRPSIGVLSWTSAAVRSTEHLPISFFKPRPEDSGADQGSAGSCPCPRRPAEAPDVALIPMARRALHSTELANPIPTSQRLGLGQLRSIHSELFQLGPEWERAATWLPQVEL